MQFAPKTDADLASENLIPAKTECDFEVVKAVAKKSKAGNEMIEVKLAVWHGERKFLMTDYLMASMGFKLLHFCEATGLTDRYAAGRLEDHDCVGRTGRLEVKVEPPNGDFPPKNSVKDYIGHRETKTVTVGAAQIQRQAPAPKPEVQSNSGVVDDIPFNFIPPLLPFLSLLT